LGNSGNVPGPNDPRVKPKDDEAGQGFPRAGLL
jgi:hypothetical protein